MIVKINYEVVLSDKKKEETRMVAIKATQGDNIMYFDTNIWVKEENFNHGVISGLPMADKYNIYLYKYRNEIESIELEMISRGRNASLQTLSYVIKDNISAGIPIMDFTRAVMSKSDRQESTKCAYITLAKDIIAFTGEATTINDMTYDWLIGFNDYLKSKKIQRNTIIGRNKLLRALINEAIKRRLIPYDENPFLNYHIPKMQCKRGYLEQEDLNMIAAVEGLNENQRHIRDAFLFCCYTGLRYSDMLTLYEAKIKNGWIMKTMYKTKFDVNIPYAVLFNGAAVDILDRNKDIVEFANIGNNSTANRLIREVVAKTNIDKHVTWHLARHTCATLLLRNGVLITSVKYILGHQEIKTTMLYAEINEKTVMADIMKIFTPRGGFDETYIPKITSNSKTCWEERKLEMAKRQQEKKKKRKKNKEASVQGNS